jgi:DNA-binding MarR family transcriptional regulator
MMVPMADDLPLSRLLLEAFRVVDADVAAALGARGASDLSPGHAAALLLVGPQGERLTDLASRAGITKQAMMQVVDDLESLGHVRRAADPADARAKLVQLTAKGRREQAGARRAVAGVESSLRRRLGSARYDQLRATLGSLVA